jgi:hypothetical protein
METDRAKKLSGSFNRGCGNEILIWSLTTE